MARLLEVIDYNSEQKWHGRYSVVYLIFILCSRSLCNFRYTSPTNIVATVLLLTNVQVNAVVNVL